MTTATTSSSIVQANPGIRLSTIRRLLGGNGGLQQLRRQLEKAGCQERDGGWYPCEQGDLSDSDIHDLLAEREVAFLRRQRLFTEENYRAISVDDQPYVIVHMGDPHLDDDGTDIRAIERDLKTIRNTPRMFAGCVGDVTNNWVGRLAALYANQTSSAEQAWRLAEWFFSSAPFLYVCLGNHDQWSGHGDPLQWIVKNATAQKPGTDLRLVLEHGVGVDPLKIHVRHDFPGHSQWNPTHAHMKAAYLGDDADVLVSGHRHQMGMGLAVRPDGSQALCLQVGSYKVLDDYAVQRGFRPHQSSPVCCTLVRPRVTGPDRVQVYWTTSSASEALQQALCDAKH